MKTKTYLLASIVAMATTLPTSAQVSPMIQIPFRAERILPGQKSATPRIDMEKEYPLLKGELFDNTASPFVKQPTTVLNKNRNTVPLMINQNLAIYGNLISEDFTGMCSFNPTSTINFTHLAAYKKGIFNGGCGIVGDELHGIYYDTSASMFGIIIVFHYAFDMYTWDMVMEPKMMLNKNSLIALETANDPTTDKTFGEFYTDNLKGLEWGEIDYTTMTRTTIGIAERIYVALGITSDGRAFGISTDGDLYQIDRTTGAETLKGSTGLQIKKPNGNYFIQSGEIDPQTDEFYWAATDVDGNSKLYTVDLNDAHLTEVGSFDNSKVIGMTIPKAKAADGAPDAVKDVKMTFTKEQKFGTVSFQAPSKTYGGAPLTGDLKYSITANGEEIAKDKPTAPGAKTNATAYVNKEGMYVFTITTSNSQGESPKVKVKKYIGYDVPKPVTDVVLNINKATRKATVRWNAPTEGIHEGYIGNLKYDVYRIKNSDTTLVANNTPLTSFNETLQQTGLSNFAYAICAVNTTQKSEWATSNSELFGNVLEPPYFDDLENENTSKIYTIIDNNNDGKTWIWGGDPDTGKSKAFIYKYSKENNGDDWLITPTFKLKGGTTYNVVFKVSSMSSSYSERIEVKWGNSPTVEGMTEELMPATEVASKHYKEYERQFTPTADGEYNIGFHAISDADRYNLFVDDISIEAAPDQAAPAAVTELKATPDPTGDLKATISFNAPDKTVSGAALTDITKIEIKSADRLVKEITSPAPGSAQTVIDDNAQEKYNVYTIIAYNDKGYGIKAKTQVYVGVDVPNKPDPKTTDNTTSVKINWESVTGANGGALPQNEVEYNIFNVNPDNGVGERIITLEGNTTEYTIEGLSNNEGEQAYAKWAMNAKTTTGVSGYAVASLIVGKPYMLPYHNSFKDGKLEGKFVAQENSRNGVIWSIIKTVSVDNDGGSMIFFPSKAGFSSIIPGKISLKGASNPKLIFDYQCEAASPGKLEMIIRHKDGTFSPAVWTHDFSSETNVGKWNNVIVNLPTSLANEDYALLYIKGTSTGDMSQAPIYVDNINIADPLQKDIEISLTAPQKLKKGQMANLKLKLTGCGIDKIENAKVKVTVNNKVVHESTVSQAIGFARSVEVPVDYRTTTLDQSTTLNVKAEVTAEGDLEADNNTATATITLEKANVEAPTDLKHNSQHKPNVELAWKAPVTPPEMVNDDFESYDAWGFDLGRWTTVDVDHGKANSLTQQGNYPHQGEEFAFMNWQPADIFRTGQGLDPHSGNRAAVAIYQEVEGQSFIDSDNWLISPPLSGKEQTVRFWVNNVKSNDGSGTETFEVLTSTTNNDTASFHKLGDTHKQGSGEWTEISIKVPQGTRYFAIHHITVKDQAFIFMVDDATFETSNSPVSFNVYRDNEYLGNTTELTFIDNSPDAGTKDHSYSITAVYFDNSESDPITISVANLLDSLRADGQTSYTVYTLDGKLILKDARNLKSLPKGVYVINGKKTTILK